MKRWQSLMSIVVAVGVVAAGCADDEERSSGSGGSGTEDLEVGRYASSDPGSVNTYWLETSDGLVVIDAQRTPSDADRVLAAIEDTGLPVTASSSPTRIPTTSVVWGRCTTPTHRRRSTRRRPPSRRWRTTRSACSIWPDRTSRSIQSG